MRPAKMNFSTMTEYLFTPEHSGESFHRSVLSQLVPPARVTVAATKVAMGLVLAVILASALTLLQ